MGVRFTGWTWPLTPPQNPDIPSLSLSFFSHTAQFLRRLSTGHSSESTDSKHGTTGVPRLISLL